jgi:hypothetical protein
MPLCRCSYASGRLKLARQGRSKRAILRSGWCGLVPLSTQVLGGDVLPLLELEIDAGWVSLT